MTIEIVADINVRFPVAVDVPEHHRQSPLEQRTGHRRPLRGHELPAADDIPLEPELPKVSVKHIRQTVLLDAAPLVEPEPILKSRPLNRHAVHGGNHPAPPDGSEVEVGVWHIHQGRVPVMRDVNVEAPVCVNVRQRQRHAATGRGQAGRLIAYCREAVPVIPEQKRSGVNRVDDKIGVAIPVEIGERGSSRIFTGAIDSVLPCHLLELPVAPVEVQMVGVVQSAQVNIAASIAVNITQRNA